MCGCSQVWDPDALADTGSASLHHRHKVTPYADMQLRGKVQATFVRGHQVFSQQTGPCQAACGRPVLKHEL